MDLIDRQAAVLAIKTRQWLTEGAKEALADQLERLPSAQPYTDGEIQKMQDIEQAQLDKAYEMGKADALRWIPCSERLPKDYEDVLVWYEYFRYSGYNRIAQTWDVGYYISEFNRWGGGVTGQKVRAIAWMPLPEPYKKDDHD